MIAIVTNIYNNKAWSHVGESSQETNLIPKPEVILSRIVWVSTALAIQFLQQEDQTSLGVCGILFW